MFSSGPNYNKLKTNLRLAISRLKLLEKKKTELNQKAKKEVADYLAAGKVERAKIRVEYCIREDYLVEGMEMTELYCDMILARFGIIEQSKELEAGLAESISSVIWVTPQLATEVAELKVICDQLTRKFGKPYAMACQSKEVSTISERLIHKMSVQAPPKVMVEKYLVEIANNYNIEYEPDPQVMSDSQCESLINLDEKNNLGNNSISAPVGGAQMNIPPAGFVGYPGQPMAPFAYPPAQDPASSVFNLPSVPGQAPYPQAPYPGGATGYNIAPGGPQNFPPGGPPPPDPGADPLPPKINNMDNVSGAGTGTGTGKWDELLGLDNSPPPPYSSFMPSGHTGDFGPPPNAPPPSLPGDGQPVRREFPPDVSPGATNLKDGDKPKPSPRSKFGEGTNADFNLPDLPTIPDLPSVPGSNTVQNPNETTEDIDFDDLTKRFEELKKKK